MGLEFFMINLFKYKFKSDAQVPAYKRNSSDWKASAIENASHLDPEWKDDKETLGAQSDVRYSLDVNAFDEFYDWQYWPE